MTFTNLVKTVVRVCIAVSFSWLTCCSLNYGSFQDTEAAIPEFSFNKTVFTRYEGGKPSVSLKSDKLEQYKSDSASFAKNAVFKTFDTASNKLTTEGQCNLLSIDTNNKLYILFDNININLIEQNAVITGSILKYNGNSEQVCSDKKSTTTIKRDDVTVSGKGFSASGITKSFTFDSSAEGTIQTNEQADNKNTLQDTPDADEN